MQGTLHVYHPSRSLLLFEHLNLSSASASSSSSTTPTTPATNNAPSNTLLFIGGMYDNFLTPHYTTDLARLLRPSKHWRLIHVQLSSAMRGFGVSSLAKDVSELAVAVKFIRETMHVGATTGKIVLLGHSTGCQDALSYLSLASPASPLASRPKVDGIILQAPVSDRDSATPSPLDDPSPDKVKAWQACLAFARAAVTTADPSSSPSSSAAGGSGKLANTTILPLHLTTPFFGPAPLSVARFLSLASPESPAAPREDDLFSWDATEEWLGRTWGRAFADPSTVDGGGTGVLNPFPVPLSLPTRADGEGTDRGAAAGARGGAVQGVVAAAVAAKRQILLLPSAADEHVPAWVDKAALVRKWTAAVEKAGGEVHAESTLVEGAVHDLGGEGVEERWGRLVEMRGRVLRYLDGVLGVAAAGGAGGGGASGGGVRGEEAVWRVWEDERAVLVGERDGERGTGGGDGDADADADLSVGEEESSQGARARGASASKI